MIPMQAAAVVDALTRCFPATDYYGGWFTPADLLGAIRRSPELCEAVDVATRHRGVPSVGGARVFLDRVVTHRDRVVAPCRPRLQRVELLGAVVYRATVRPPLSADDGDAAD